MLQCCKKKMDIAASKKNILKYFGNNEFINYEKSHYQIVTYHFVLKEPFSMSNKV